MHPVRTAFLLARRLAPPGSSAARGAVAWLAVMAVHMAVGAALLWGACRTLGPPGYVAAAAVLLKLSLGHALLYQTVLRVAGRLEEGDLEGARREVQGIVRRDASRLGPGHVASAAVESLAENLVDAYTSPLLYAVLLGPLGALAQRIANTLDGALGYKTPDYARAGRVSAAADTLLNYAPARLTALLIALAAPLAGGSVRASLAAVVRCAGATESVNAGYPISAMAGALGVTLEKPGAYTICPGRPLPGPREVRAAVAVAVAVAGLATLAAAAWWLALA